MQAQLPTTENSLFRPALNLESTEPTIDPPVIDPPEGQGGSGGGGTPAPATPEEEEEEQANP